MAFDSGICHVCSAKCMMRVVFTNPSVNDVNVHNLDDLGDNNARDTAIGMCDANQSQASVLRHSSITQIKF